jgi:hypothetical protein
MWWPCGVGMVTLNVEYLTVPGVPCGGHVAWVWMVTLNVEYLTVPGVPCGGHRYAWVRRLLQAGWCEQLHDGPAGGGREGPRPRSWGREVTFFKHNFCYCCHSLVRSLVL